MTDHFDLEIVQRRIKSRMEELGTNAKKVSKDAEIGETAVYDIVSGKNQNPSLVH